MSGLIWIQTVWHSDGIPERIFRKSWFWKKSADDKKHKQFPRRQRVKALWIACLLEPLHSNFIHHLWLTSVQGLKNFVTSSLDNGTFFLPQKMYHFIFHKTTEKVNINKISLLTLCLVCGSIGWRLSRTTHETIALTFQVLVASSGAILTHIQASIVIGPYWAGNWKQDNLTDLDK